MNKDEFDKFHDFTVLYNNAFHFSTLAKISLEVFPITNYYFLSLKNILLAQYLEGLSKTFIYYFCFTETSSCFSQTILNPIVDVPGILVDLKLVIFW